MNKHLLELDKNRECTAEWPDVDPVNEPRQANFDATGRTDGPRFIGRIYIQATDTFGPVPAVSKSRKEELKEIRNQRPWTPDEFQEAIAESL